MSVRSSEPPPEKSRAGIFREHLRVAEVDAPAFFVETPTHLMIDFRSLRDSGITWRFLAEHRAEVVQREAGHEHISTTLGYAKEVQDKRGRYGEPLPTLPASLGESSNESSNGEGGPSQVVRIKSESRSGRRGLKPTSHKGRPNTRGPGISRGFELPPPTARNVR